MLKNHDKLIMRMINDQVTELNKRKASDQEILKVLNDFISDTKIIMSYISKKETKQYHKKYPLFSYFKGLVQGRVN